MDFVDFPEFVRTFSLNEPFLCVCLVNASMAAHIFLLVTKAWIIWCVWVGDLHGNFEYVCMSCVITFLLC